MALNLKNSDVERLVGEVVALTGETKTGAIRIALSERLARLAFQASSQDRGARLFRFLASEAWPAVPEAELGRRLTGAQEEAILGLRDSSGNDPG